MNIPASLALLVVLLSLAHSKIIAHHSALPSDLHSQMANVNELTSISNLAVNNWVLGNITQDQYFQKRFETTKNHNTSLCPLDRPFVQAHATSCAQCPSNTPIFVLANDTCVGCPTGETYSKDTNQCENINNGGSVKSPPSSPSSGSSAPSALLADTTSFKNISNLEANNWVLGKLTKDQYDQKRFLITKTTNTTLCPIDTPYVLKGKTSCEDCPPSAPIFSLENDTCIGCAAGEYFDEKSSQCLNKNAPKINATQPKPSSSAPTSPLADTTGFVNVSNLDASNWVLGKITQDQYNQKRFEIAKSHNTSLCPLETPYVLKGKTTCEDCPPKTPIFVLENDTCVGCQAGQYFNNETNQCQNVNKTSPNTTKKSSPSDVNGPLIDVTDFKNITNLDGNNWILGNMTIEEYYVERFKIVHNQNTTQCDIETPYVIEGHGGICQPCPIDRPIFVLANSTCIPCPNGLKWSLQQQNCTKQNETAPVANTTNATTPAKNNTNTSTAQPKINATNTTNATNATNATQPNITSPKNDTKVTSPQPTTNQTNNQTQPPKNDTKVVAPTPTLPNKTQPEPTTPPPSNTTKNDTKVTSSKPSTNTTSNKNDTKVTAPKPNTTEPYKDIDTCSSYVDCPSGQYFDYQTGSCESCQFGQYFDVQYQACLYCAEETPFLDASFACIKCPSGKSIDRKTNKCL